MITSLLTYTLKKEKKYITFSFRHWEYVIMSAEWNITRTTRGNVKQNLHPPFFHRMRECTRNILRQPKRSSAKPLKSAHPSPWCSTDNINTLFTGKGITRPQFSRKRDIKDRHTPADGAHTHTHLLITPSLNTPQSDCKGHPWYFKVPCQPKTHLHTSGRARSQHDWHLFCKGTARETGSARVCKRGFVSSSFTGRQVIDAHAPLHRDANLASAY